MILAVPPSLESPPSIRYTVRSSQSTAGQEVDGLLAGLVEELSVVFRVVDLDYFPVPLKPAYKVQIAIRASGARPSAN